MASGTHESISKQPLTVGHTDLPSCLSLAYLTTGTLITCGRFIHDWVYSGVFRDIYGEFMIQVNHEYLSFRGR